MVEIALPFVGSTPPTEPANRSQSAIAGKFGAIAEKSKPPERLRLPEEGRVSATGFRKVAELDGLRAGLG